MRLTNPSRTLLAAAAAMLLIACGGDEPGGDADTTTIKPDATVGDTTDAEDDVEAGACTEQFAPCDDGNPCTKGDKCWDGECRGAVDENACNDGNPCTADSCDKALGCQNTPRTNSPCDDGNPCTSLDKCTDAGTCSGGAISDIECNDGNICTSGDICVSGVCKGEKRLCNDLSNCTQDLCDATHPDAEPGTGCVHLPLEGSCDDLNSCTTADTCVDGVCTGTPDRVGEPCQDGDLCTDDDVCQDDGSCAGTLVTDCDDDNPCTIDSCTPQGCKHTPDVGLACDDGDKCTIDDACTAEATCEGGPKCVAPDACTETACVAETGTCVNTAKACDDQNPCTDNSCNPTTGCVYPPNTASCDDGSLCTTGDACSGGACVGTPKVCDPGADTECAENTCDPETGACAMKQLNGKPCADGDACTVNDVCAGGVCKGQAKTCYDSDPCTDDYCDAETGQCENPPVVGDCTDLAFERTNDYREVMGLPLMKNHDVIIDAAEKHCAYYVNNPEPYDAGLSPHNEDNAYQGFTGVGFGDRMAAAGWDNSDGFPTFEVMAFVNDEVKAVDGWMATLYHRIPYILPRVLWSGYGNDQKGLRKCDTQDFASSPTGNPDWEGMVILFPTDGMTNVPTWWDGLENPQPPMPPGEAYPSGPILTVSFGATNGDPGASLQSSQIMSEDGDLIVHVASDPQDDPSLCCGILTLYPVAPLEPFTTYTVTVDYSKNGTPGSVEWSFTTGDGSSTFFQL